MHNTYIILWLAVDLRDFFSNGLHTILHIAKTIL